MVDYVMHMGSDDTVCDAARVSMDKMADMFTPSQNERLINYLAKYNHWSPFSHVTVQMRFRAPIFIARQLAKHQIGFSWNEVSRRYVSSSPTFYTFDYIRPSAENIKQGSVDKAHPESDEYLKAIDSIHKLALVSYNSMISQGVCPEQARAILPQSMMTEWIWTGSLYAWARMYSLRSDKHAQLEVQRYADAVDAICCRLFPISWAALKEA